MKILMTVLMTGIFSLFVGMNPNDQASLSPRWTSLPIAISMGDGTFRVSDYPIGDFSAWMATPGVYALDSDFNGDGRTDLMLIRDVSGWTTVPMAFATADSGLMITNEPVLNLPGWLATSGVEPIDGDFDGDGKTDLALVRQDRGWTTIPMAFSNGGGDFRITNMPGGSLSGWFATSGVEVVDGDFDGDGKTDFALVRQDRGWTTIPMAFSNGDGTFRTTNMPGGSLSGWFATSGVEVIDGDFDGDGKTDFALIRQDRGWTTIPVAFSNGDGTFRVTNAPGGNLPDWFATSDVEPINGDFNGDGKTDFALVRQDYGWTTIPMAFSNGDGTFRTTNMPGGTLSGWFATVGVEVIDGDFDGDGKTDLALVRQAIGWTTIPMGLSNGDGTFRIVNQPAGRLADWLATEGVEVIDGDFNGDGKTDLLLVKPGM